MTDAQIIPNVKYLYRAGTGWGFMRFMDIPDAAAPHLVYLRRFIIFKTPWCALYLHQIFLPDKDRDPHNHPFPFISLILRGGYVEERTYGTPNGNGKVLRHSVWRTRKRWSIAKTTLADFHQIKRLSKNTVSLVLCGPRSQDWGYLTVDGFVPYKDYEKCTTN